MSEQALQSMEPQGRRIAEQDNAFGNAAEHKLDENPAAPHIPDHQLFRRIGRGSYGEVWLARTVMGRYRAVKVVYRRSFKEPRPFERELAGIQRYEPVSRSHEGLVDVLHIGRNDPEGVFYYVMELADDIECGQELSPETYNPHTLSGELRRRGSLSPAACAQLGLTLSQALQHLHGKGLVHRDIKPSNIIFVNGTPKLADIGLVSGMDETCSLVGTPGYIAPEGPGQPAADVFSLGKVLYECCTGQDRNSFPNLPTELETCPDREQLLELNEVILRACHHDARQRYQSAEDLGADLALVLNHKSVRRLRFLERRLARIKRVSVSLGVAGLVVSGLVYQSLREKNFRAEQRERRIGGHMAYGLQHLESGQLPQSLPYFVEALRLDDQVHAAKHRLRLGMALEQCPKLLGLWVEKGEVTDGQFSPDGRWAVLACDSARAEIKDLQTGETVRQLSESGWLLDKASFSPDGKFVLTAAQNNTASLWERATGKLVFTLRHPGKVFGARFNPSGDRIATACGDNLVRVWDSKTTNLLFTLQGHTQGVLHVDFSHAGSKLVSVGRDQRAFLWDAQTGAPLNRGFPHASWVYYAAFSPDDRHLVTGCFDKAAHVWDVATGQEVLSPLLHNDGVVSAVYSPDGRLILTACWDGTARLWDAATGRPAMPNPILPHGNRVRRAAFHPDGHRVLTVCLDGTVRLWDLAASAVAPTKVPGQYSQDGSKLLLQSNRRLEVSETKTGRRYPPVESAGGIREAALNRNGEFLLTLEQADNASTNQNSLAIRQSATGRRVFSLAGYSNSLAEAALGETGQWLVTWREKKARVYDLRAGKPQPSLLAHDNAVSAAYFSPQGNHLLTFSGKDAYLWDLASGKLNCRLAHSNLLRCASFSPDGRLLVTGTADPLLTPCEAQVWDVATGHPLGPPLVHRDGVRCVSFSPDGRRVVTGSEDFTAAIWNLGQPGKPKKLSHPHQVWGAVFSPDGAYVLTLCNDRSTRLWDAETGEPISRPLSFDEKPQYGVFPDENHFALCNSNASWLWLSKPMVQPMEDLLGLVRLLNCKELEGETDTTPQPAALQAAWQKLTTKHPELFRTTEEELAAWHRQNGQAAKTARLWAAAVFHFERLVALQPTDTSMTQAYEECLRQLQAQKEIKK